MPAKSTFVEWTNKFILAKPIALIIALLLTMACATKGIQPASQETSIRDKEPVGESYANILMAQMAYQNGAFSEAKDYVFKALSKDPESPYLCLFMSILLRHENNIQDAMIYAKRAVALKADYHEAYAQIGDLYILQKDDDKAAEAYKKSFEFDPSNERVAFMLLNLHMRGNDHDAALKTLDKLIQKRPELGIARYYKAKVLMDMDLLEEAERLLVDLVESDGDIQAAVMDLLEIYEVTGRYAEAKELLAQILAQNPSDLRIREKFIGVCIKLNDKGCVREQVEYLENNGSSSVNSRKLLSSIYFQTKRYKEAIDILENLIDEDPSDEKTRYLLGLCYEGTNRLDDAKKLFDSFPEDSEFFRSSIYEMIKILLKEKKYKQALSYLDKNKDKLITDSQFFIIHSFISEKIEGVNSAVEVIKKGLEIIGDDEDLLYRLGVLYDKAKKKARALEVMNGLLKKNKDHADALNYIGYTYAEENRHLKEALRMIKRALKLKPGSGYIIDSLGWVYFRLGDLNKAKQYLHKALELEPKDPTINEHLGELYEALGSKEKAIFYYNKSLSLGNPEKERIKRVINRLKGK